MKTQKERVTGIGGVFFKARDPVRLLAWYEQNLGIRSEAGCADFPWREKDRPETVGRTIWSIFPEESDHLGPEGTFMINYRVADLDKMMAQLRENGVAVEKIEDHDYGRFAWLTDPEGRRIELWQPKEE